MANISKTAFEARVTGQADETNNITGIFIEGGGNAVCEPGRICVRSAQKELSGHGSMSNENAFYMTAANADDNHTMYAANPYDWRLIDARERMLYALGVDTLGLSIPAGREGTFTQIKFNNKSVYRFGVDNINGTVGSNTFFTVDNGWLVPSSAAPTSNGSVYFELRSSGSFTEGGNNAYGYYDMVAKMVVGVSSPPTPVEEYKAVEYIETTGDAWIDTGLTLDGAYKFIIEAACFMNTDTISAVIVSHASTAESNGRQGCMVFNTSTHKVDFFWPGVPYSTMPVETQINLWQKYKITQDASEIRIEQGEYSSYQIYMGSTTTTNTSPLLLMHSENPNHLQYSHGKLYSAKIQKGSELIRDFVPKVRKLDNVAGLWDNVTNTFYVSSGAGGFIAGPDV